MCSEQFQESLILRGHFCSCDPFDLVRWSEITDLWLWDQSFIHLYDRSNQHTERETQVRRNPTKARENISLKTHTHILFSECWFQRKGSGFFFQTQTAGRVCRRAREMRCKLVFSSWIAPSVMPQCMLGYLSLKRWALKGFQVEQMKLSFCSECFSFSDVVIIHCRRWNSTHYTNSSVEL